MKKFIAVLLLFVCCKLIAQDTLPAFKAIILNDNKAQISWINPYSNCVQISVQRSYDSLRFFQTIFSSQSPELPQNGFADNNFMSQIKMYYRIFYVLDDGKFFFTASKTAVKLLEKATTKKQKPVKNIDTIVEKDTGNVEMIDLVKLPSVTKIPEKRMYCIYKRNADTLYAILEEKNYYKFKDSIAHKTKDTLYAFENDIIVWKPFVPKPLWKPSINVFSSEKGYVTLALPLAKLHKYRIVFFNDKQEEIFRIKHLKHEKLFLEKNNFVRSGWFYFELYEDEKLKEKNQFLIERDF